MEALFLISVALAFNKLAYTPYIWAEAEFYKRVAFALNMFADAPVIDADALLLI